MPFISTLVRSIIFFFCFILIKNTVSAQYIDLKNNKDILWIAEFSMDHDFSFNTDSEQRNIIKLIKFYSDPTNFDGANNDAWIIDWIYSNAVNGHYECFEDPGLTLQISKKRIASLTASVDTVITYDPATFEESTVIVRNELNPKTIKQLRTNQVIFYNQKSRNFETRLISVAPLLSIEGDESPVPLFWIKMNSKFPESFDIHNPNIVWGTLVNTKESPLFVNFMREVKNENNFNFPKRLKEQAFELEKPIESTECYGCNQLLSKVDVQKVYNSIDTVITFNPQTFLEEIQVVKHDFDPEKVSEYRLIQEWYYDENSKKLMNRLKAISPLYLTQSLNGKFKYKKPLYYIRYD